MELDENNIVQYAVIEYVCDEDGRYERLRGGFLTKELAEEYTTWVDHPCSVVAVVLVD